MGTLMLVYAGLLHMNFLQRGIGVGYSAVGNSARCKRSLSRQSLPPSWLDAIGPSARYLNLGYLIVTSSAVSFRVFHTFFQVRGLGEKFVGRT